MREDPRGMFKNTYARRQDVYARQHETMTRLCRETITYHIYRPMADHTIYLSQPDITSRLDGVVAKVKNASDFRDRLRPNLSSS